MGKLTVRSRSAALGLLVMALAAACTSTDDGRGGDPPATGPGAGPSSTPSSLRDSDVTAPELDEEGGEELVGRQAVTRGSAAFDYVSGPRGKALIVAVSCKGAGTVRVNVPAVAMWFPLRCGRRAPEVAYNHFAAQAAHRAGTVEVTAPSSVTWSVTVGRGEPVREEAPPE